MSVGGIIGAVVGGTIGFVISGFNPMGAIYGASLGFSLGMYIDPIIPDIPTPGAPIPIAGEIMTSEVGGPLPDLLGTAKITGHLLCYGNERTATIMCQPEVEGGKGGPPEPDPYISGYEYYMTWVVGIVAGPVDTLYAVYKGEDVVWEGVLNIPASGGEETITLEGMGSATFYFGTGDQIANSTVGELIGDSTLNSPYRHFCWCIFNDCFIGDYNRCPTMKFILRKAPEIAFSGDNVIQTYDYNPIHAIWYILHDLAGLPESWLHYDDFVAAATTIASNTHGICCLFESQQSTLSYLETINNHIDCIIRYGSDGKFHPKLIRDDYVLGDLPLIDEDVMLDDPTLNRKSWINTVNEVKVQYTKIPREETFPQGEWVAALPQVDTPYIYLYDRIYGAVIKIKTSVSPPVVSDRLSLSPLFDLDYEMGKGITGTQRGGYCISKDGERLWYLFRENSSGDCQLIEVDISKSNIRAVKKTTFSGLLPGEKINDVCTDGTYTYWCTNLVSGRIIKIRNSDHSIIDDHLFTSDELYPYGCFTWKEAIASIDYSEDTGNLYWIYVLDGMGCSPAHDAHSCYTISDTDLNIITQYETGGSGLNAPKWQNFVRIHDGFVLNHQAYYPTSGWLSRRGLSDFALILPGKRENYLQNILGVYEGHLYTLWHEHAIDIDSFLDCIHFDSFIGDSVNNVSYYTASKDAYDWGETSVSAMSEQTGVIILVRYNNVESKNYIASFEAASGIPLIDDSTPLTELDTIDLRRSISNPNATDVGNMTVQDRLASKTIKLPLFTTNENAVWASNQQLMKESYPFASISVPVNRDLFRLQVGDCFKFSYSHYGISEMICRVLTVTEESLDSENITIHAIEDFYSVANVIIDYTAPEMIQEQEDPYILTPIVNQTVIETPYLLTSNVEVIPIAERRSLVDLGMHVHLSFDDGSSYTSMGSASNFRPYGTLVGTYTDDTYTIDDTVGFIIDFSNDDVDLIDTITWPATLAGTNNNAMLGNELITFQTITPVSGTNSQYKIENIIRDRLDTGRESHTHGEDFYCLGSYSITSLHHSEITTGADRKFKLVPYNLKGSGDLSEADVINLSIEGRAKKPYIPINFHANDGSYAARYSDDVVLTWSPCFRGTGAGIGTPGTTLSETDREGLFRIEVWVSSVNVRDITDIDAATWTYTEAMNLTDNGSLATSVTFKLFNFRVESGITYETDAVEVTCKKEL